MNNIGSSDDTDISYFVCADVPDIPDAPVLETSSKNSITIAWNPPTSDGGSPITGYRAYMNNLINDEWTLIYDGLNYPSTLTFKESGLTAGKYYRFRVSAINYVGEGKLSADVSFIAADYPSAPGQPFLISST